MEKNSLSAGFSLIEILITFFILGVILIAILSTLGVFFKSNKTANTIEDLQFQTNLIINDLISEIRWSTEADIINNGEIDSLKLKNKDNQTVFYYVDDGKLYKEIDGDSEILIDKNINVNKFDITASGATVALLETKIELEGKTATQPIKYENSIIVSLRRKEINF